jgi:hypothetical protein
MLTCSCEIEFMNWLQSYCLAVTTVHSLVFSNNMMYVTQKPIGWVSVCWAYKEIICSLSSFRTLVSSLQLAMLCYTACGHIYKSYMCNVQITQQLRRLGVLLIMILHVWLVNQPTIIIVALCTKQNKRIWIPLL